MHIPVLRAEVIEYLAVRPDGVYLDATAGLGGHTREIAQRLTLREHTVKNYLFRIFDKLGVSSRVEVVLYALGGQESVRREAAAATTKKETSSATVANPREAARAWKR